MRPEPLYRVFIGFDAAEMRAWNVAHASLYLHTNRGEVCIDRISMLSLGDRYNRPTTRMPNGQLFDEISGAPMSTGHAIARFHVPALCNYQGWALFTDGDVLFRDDVRHLFALADERFAVQVVQHPPVLDESEKKAGHVQQAYHRKLWSSVVLWNCAHPAHVALTLEVLNSWPGRDLHAFRWLKDDEIGALPARWNWLPQDSPALVHYTRGCPDIAGHEHDAFADEWFSAAKLAGYHLDREKAAP